MDVKPCVCNISSWKYSSTTDCKQHRQNLFELYFCQHLPVTNAEVPLHFRKRRRFGIGEVTSITKCEVGNLGGASIKQAALSYFEQKKPRNRASWKSFKGH